MEVDSKEITQSTPKIPDDEAVRIIQNFKSRAQSANQIAIILITILITFWISGLEPRAEAITNYLGVATIRCYRSDTCVSQSVFSDSERKRKRSEKQSRQSQESKRGEDTRHQERIILPGAAAQVDPDPDPDEKLKQLESEAKKQAKTPYEFPGGLKASIPIDSAPVLWFALSAFTMYYLHMQRNSLLNLGIRIAKKSLDSSHHDLHYQEILDGAPWWLAPLPYRKHQSAIREHLKSVFGWTNEFEYSILTITCFTLFILIQARVLYLSYVFVNLAENTQTEWMDWIMPTMATLLLIAGLIASLPGLVRNASPGDGLPANYRSTPLRRRRILGFGLLALAATLFDGFANHSIDQNAIVIRHVANESPYKLRPRFKKKTDAPTIIHLGSRQDGLYRNKKTDVMYVATKGGVILSSSRLKEQNLELVNEGYTYKDVVSRLEKSGFVRAAELYSLDLIDKNKIDLATQFLLEAIRFAYKPPIDKHHLRLSKVAQGLDKSVIRLCDLLAGLALKYDNDLLDSLRTEKAFISQSFWSDPFVKSRLSQWKNPQSNWSKKWSSSSSLLPWRRVSPLPKS